MTTRCFSDLPKGVQDRIKKRHPRDYETWVGKSVPALKNKSVLAVMNESDGYQKVTEYLGKVEGYFGF